MKEWLIGIIVIISVVYIVRQDNYSKNSVCKFGYRYEITSDGDTYQMIGSDGKTIKCGV